ncbi:MAG: ABC transporter permease [Alphaproteobacteria bacterium]|nr:ABC transporter permease [Alphaproteobacteria bacterium]
MSKATRYLNEEPFEPRDTVALSDAELRAIEASSWTGFWRRFARHRLAFVSGLFLLALYAMLPFVELLAPYPPDWRDSAKVYAPPQSIRLFHDGALHPPFVYGTAQSLNPETFAREFVEDRTQPQALRFFCTGSTYRFWELWEGSAHLVCPAKGASLHLLGTDRLGRDIFSRILYGARVSLTIGIIGVAISLVLGMALGGLAGYFGGWTDTVIQRLIELVRSLPELPLWMALSAALPVTWPPLTVYLGITIILGLLDWPSLARAVRARFMTLREEEFVLAAELMGASPARVIGRHMLPNFASHLIANATLAIPAMILGETALSFLGLGIREPMTSWGLMLDQARRIEAILFYPWILAPMVPVILTVLAFNFVGDGLRDAADPHQG